MFRDEREVSVDAPAHAVFQAVCMLGGTHGWYSSAWLWRLRGGMDRLVGGPGLRRGRVNPDRLSYGEALDFWRVVGIETDRSLLLRAEMRLPGTAALEFCITPVGSSGAAACTLKQVARFQPKGLWGIFYWYGVLPFHGIVFKGMLEGIKKQAEKIASATPPLVAAQQVPPESAA